MSIPKSRPSLIVGRMHEPPLHTWTDQITNGRGFPPVFNLTGIEIENQRINSNVIGVIYPKREFRPVNFPHATPAHHDDGAGRVLRSAGYARCRHVESVLRSETAEL